MTQCVSALGHLDNNCLKMFPVHCMSALQRTFFFWKKALQFATSLSITRWSSCQVAMHILMGLAYGGLYGLRGGHILMGLAYAAVGLAFYSSRLSLFFPFPVFIFFFLLLPIVRPAEKKEKKSKGRCVCIRSAGGSGPTAGGLRWSPLARLTAVKYRWNGGPVKSRHQWPNSVSPNSNWS